MRILAIDGLRAIAMTMVVAQHCGLLPFGWTGVWLFFVISGYVITQGFVTGAYGTSTVRGSYFDFLARRASRIMPAYFLYLLTCVIALLLAGESEKLVDLGHLVTFTYNWQMIFQWWPGFGGIAPFGHLWTLCIEQQFYLLFGLFAVLLPVRTQVTASLALIALGPFLRWLWSLALEPALLHEPGRHAFAVYAATHCHADAFLLGSLIARLEPEIRRRPRAVTTVSVAALAIAAAYALTYVSINRALGAQGTAALRNVFSGVLYGEHREVFVYLAVDMVAAAVLVHVLLARRGTGMLSRPALVWVGRISYGGYLFHALVLWIAGRASFETPINELPLPERVTVFVMLWGVTVALASASFVWFEKPLARYLCRKRVMRSRQVSESDATFRTNEPVSAFQNAAPGG